MLSPLLLVLATPDRTLEVYAAASLREAFTTIAQKFEGDHPGVRVRLNFAGSQTLAAQVLNGAPADVFASASPKNLQGLAYDPKTRVVFATNRLVVLGAPSLRALTQRRRIILAAPSVPVGDYARRALKAAGRQYGAAWLASVQKHVVSEENDVRAVLTKFRLGEADAAIVYASDAKGIPVPAAFAPTIQYPAAVLRDAHEPVLAQAFVTALRAPASRRALSARGFGLP